MTLIKPSLILFISLLSILSVWAQNPDSHQKKQYIDSVQTYYVQQSLPVYLNISTDPQGGNAHQLQNSTPEAITFERHGVYQIKVQNVANGSTAETYRIHADGVKPTTSLSLTTVPKHTADGTTFYGVGLQGSLTASDKMSGVAQIYQSVNSPSYNPYGSTIRFDQEGKYDFNYYTVDNVGNVEDPKNRRFTVDLTAPSTNHTVEGIELTSILSPKTKLSLQASDNLAGVENTSYAFNDNSLKTYTAAINISSLPDGEHTFKYRSIDNVKNEETEKTYSFYLDKIAPETSFTITGDKFQGSKLYVSPRTKIELAAADNKAGVENIFYRLNGGDIQTYSSPFLLPQKTGSVGINYYAVDKVENTGKVGSKTLNVYYDETAPSVKSAFSGATFTARDTTFITAQTKIVLTASDKEAGVQQVNYTLDGAESTYTQSFTVAQDGYHKLDFTSKDNVNNQTENQHIEFYVDDTPPVIRIDKSANSLGTKNEDGIVWEVYPSYVIFYLSAIDYHVGSQKIHYAINDGKMQEYAAPIQGFKKGAKVQLLVRAIDNLGNPVDTTFNFIVSED